MKRLLLFLLLVGAVNLNAKEIIFEPKYPGDRITSPDWTAIYSHLPEGMMDIQLENVTGASFSKAITFSLLRPATPQKEVIGKGSYVRSGPLNYMKDHLIVEWWENIAEAVPGPSFELAFELWGKVGAKPNDRGNLVLSLKRSPKGMFFKKDLLTELKPGWRHFKINIDTNKNSFDFYSEDMDQPCAKDIPLADVPEQWNHPGIGFILYLSPGVEPFKIQIGGIMVYEF